MNRPRRCSIYIESSFYSYAFNPRVTVPLEQFSVASYSLPLPDTDGNIETSELLKEKGNAAFKGSQWNKALNYYTEAIKLNGMNATYYCNRAAAYLKLA
ncbi:Outer envelope protein [Arachis hypogaea]|nr:Outer envelope protein [Arachis hypogaea]